MSDASTDRVIVAGTCFVCSGDLILMEDGKLRCENCGITLRVERKTEPPVKKEETKKETVASVAKAQPSAPVLPPPSENVDDEVVDLVKALAADPTTPITTPQMNRITKASDVTHRAVLSELLTLAESALASRKFRRAAPLFTLICNVAPTAERYISLMLAKASCASVEEIPTSDTELTTMAEYPFFLQIASAEIRDHFLSFVRRQAERKEEAEEARMEEERQAYIAAQQKQFRLFFPLFLFFALLAVCSLAGILTIGISGTQFWLGRIFFGVAVGCACLAVALFAVAKFYMRNISRAHDDDPPRGRLTLVSALSLFLIIAASLALFFSGISGGYDGRIDGIYYKEVDGGVVVAAPGTDKSVLNIPATMHGKPVIALGDFSNSTSLTTVTFPDSVTRIEPFAFAGCSQLTSILLPDTLTSLGNGVFQNCISLTTIRIPAGVSTISGYTFTGCISLSHITFVPGSQLSVIGTGAFENCTALTEIHLPDGVTIIEANAFRGAKSLTSYTGAASLHTIDARAFYECTALTSLDFSDSLRTIRTEAFYGCSALTSLLFPKSIEQIEARAFYECTNLHEAIFQPTDHAELKVDGAFDTTITFVDLPETPISHFTYSNAGDEISITGYIGESSVVSVPSYINDMPVVSIGVGAFQNTNITLVSLPNTLQFIDISAFENCQLLTTVRFGTKLEVIDLSAFKGCISLVQLDMSNCTELSDIREEAFSGCTALTSIAFSPNLRMIHKYAFDHCSALLTLTLPNSLNGIGACAFRECRALRSVRLGAGNMTIGADAFRNCNNIKQLTVGRNITILEEAYQGILYSPFTGWKEDQTVTILQAPPENFQGYYCDAYIKWVPPGE